MTSALRHLVVVLGDQLDRDGPALAGFDASRDAVWMAEVAEESTHVWTAKPRIAMFLAAMRHFATALADDGVVVHYRRLDDACNRGTLAGELAHAIAALRPQRVRFTMPGEHRVREALHAVVAAAGVPLDEPDDTHFLCSPGDFAAHAAGRRTLRMEFFYREMRRRHRVLMEPPDAAAVAAGEADAEAAVPCGGSWNYDVENRGAFGVDGPGFVPAPRRFAPDATTREVIDLVERRFADHPGRLERFDWPVTRAQALVALDDFVEHRLRDFGHWQDAMWPGEPWLYHAQISAALNLKLLNPREAIARAEAAWRDGSAPLPAVEGFVRQILGWREYVRGVYWLQMPDYLALNALGAGADLPPWYWTGETSMACLRDAIGQTLEHGYAHHIQRLMVTGLYALLLGVEPLQVHAWYLAVYVDAVEWVEAPNTLGMSQYADGGLMASKPYVASGRYIQRMGGALCRGCRFDPGAATGDRACPFTTLYWDFLARHERLLSRNPRMAMQLKNLARRPAADARAVAARASAIRAGAIDGV